jgi:outer membrane protein assembly factor BamB
MKIRSIALTIAVFFFTVSVYGQAKTALFHEAAKKNDIETLRKLLIEGVDVNFQSKYGVTALTFACDAGNLEAVNILLENNADPNIKDSFYEVTPFFWAIVQGNYEIIKSMVEHGGDISHPNILGLVNSADLEIIKLLIDKGSPGAEDLILSAVKEDNIDLMKIALSSDKLNVERLSDALIYAIAIENTEMIDLLKDAGAKIPERTEEEEKLDLNRFRGRFEPIGGNSVIIENDGTFLIVKFGNTFKFIYSNKNIFKFVDYPSVTLNFNEVEGQIVSFDLHEGSDTTKYIRIGDVMVDKSESDSKLPKIDDVEKSVDNPKNWSSFRGNNADGNGDEQHPPILWNVEKDINLKWKTFIPGLAHACPVIWEDKVFIITAIGKDTTSEYRVGLYGDVRSADDNSEHEWKMYCINRKNGDIIWEKLAYKGIPRVERHPKATHANSTPVTNGNYVVALFGSEGMVCYNMNGEEIWKKDLGILDAGWFFNESTQWGHSSSPIIYKNTVIVQCDRSKDSYIAAYDLKTGNEVWRTERDAISSWGTPTVYYGKERNELIANGTKQIKAYDPDTGTELWKLGPNSEVTVATPVVYNDLIFVTNGYAPIRPIYAIKPGGSGDISIADSLTSGEFIQWRVKRGGTYMPSPIAYDGYFYTLANNGALTCYDAKTGERKYRQSIKGGRAFTASMVAAEGKLYCTSEEKGVFIIKAGPKYEVVSNNLIGEICMATPAISNGQLFVRGQNHIFCIGYK